MKWYMKQEEIKYGREKEMKAKHDQEFKGEEGNEKGREGNPLEKEMKDEENMSGVHQIYAVSFFPFYIRTV